MPLFELQQLIAEGLATSEDVDATSGHVRNHEPPIRRPEGLGGNPARGRVGPPLAHPEHDVCLVLSQERVHLEDELRWFLEIGRHHREPLPAAQLQTGPDRRERAEIAREEHEP